MIKCSFSLNIIALNSLLNKIASFAVYNRVNNSAFILNVVTISCLFALYAISPPNNFIIYPYKLLLSTNNILLAQINDYTSFLPSLPSSHFYYLYFSLCHLFLLYLLHSKLLYSL